MKFEDGSKMRKKLQVGRLAHLFLKDLIFSQALEPSLRENDSAFGKSITHGINLWFRGIFWKIWTWEGFRKTLDLWFPPLFWDPSLCKINMLLNRYEGVEWRTRWHTSAWLGRSKGFIKLYFINTLKSCYNPLFILWRSKRSKQYCQRHNGAQGSMLLSMPTSWMMTSGKLKTECALFSSCG